MEHRFSIEAKSFCFSAKEGSPDLLLEERRKDFVGYIFASIQCSSWLVEMVEAASKVKDDIAKSYCEGDKVLMVHGGVNKAGIFLEVSAYAEGGHKGVLWLLKGRYGRGWLRFVGELRLLLASLEGKNGFVETESLPLLRMQAKQSKTAWVDASTGGSQGRSFAEVLQLKPCFELKGWSLLCMVTMLFEMRNGGVDQQLVVDCFYLENSLLAADLSKKGGISIKRWVKHLLGFFRSEMGWLLIGLLEGLLAGFEGIPLRKWIRTVLNCMGGFKGIGFGRYLMPNLDGRPKGVGFGFSLKPRASRHLKFSRKVQLKNRDRPFEGRELPSMVSSEWVSLVTSESPSPVVVPVQSLLCRRCLSFGRLRLCPRMMRILSLLWEMAWTGCRCVLSVRVLGPLLMGLGSAGTRRVGFFFGGCMRCRNLCRSSKSIRCVPLIKRLILFHLRWLFFR
jgi:hypothetical protein